MTTLDFQGCLFECYTPAEFAAAGHKKTHRPVSNEFRPAEGPLLTRWLRFFPGALLVVNGRAQPRITVYARKQPRKPRAARRKTRCGAGAARLEGLAGAISDRWAYYDVLEACTRKLRQWEEEGIIPRQPGFETPK